MEEEGQHPLPEGAKLVQVPEGLLTRNEHYEYKGCIIPVTILRSGMFQEVLDFEFRSGDVVVCSYPKTARVCDPESQRHSHLLLPLYETLEVVGFPRIVGSVSPVLPRGQSDVQPLHAPRPGLLGGASGPQPPLRHLRGAAPGRAQGHSQDRPLPPGGGERGAAGVRGRLHLLRLHGLQPERQLRALEGLGILPQGQGELPQERKGRRMEGESQRRADRGLPAVGRQALGTLRFSLHVHVRGGEGVSEEWKEEGEERRGGGGSRGGERKEE
nr:uncharacterized protein LOC113813746 isoform X2 [Penaeus vannamei]